MKLIAISSVALVFLSQVLAKPAEGCLQNHTVVETDSCFSVAQMFKLTEDDFYQMNPGLHHSVEHNCDNLDVGKPYCVCMQEPCTPEPALSAPVNATSSSAAGAVSSAASSVVSVVQISSTAAPAAASSVVSSASSVASSSQSASVAPAGSSVPAVAASAASSAAPSKASQGAKSTSGAMTVGTAVNAIALGTIMAGASLLL